MFGHIESFLCPKALTINFAFNYEFLNCQGLWSIKFDIPGHILNHLWAFLFIKLWSLNFHWNRLICEFFKCKVSEAHILAWRTFLVLKLQDSICDWSLDWNTYKVCDCNGIVRGLLTVASRPKMIALLNPLSTLSHLKSWWAFLIAKALRFNFALNSFDCLFSKFHVLEARLDHSESFNWKLSLSFWLREIF